MNKTELYALLSARNIWHEVTEHKAVTTWLDKSFLDASGLIGVHPNDNTATVWLKTQDLLRLLEENGTQITLFES